MFSATSSQKPFVTISSIRSLGKLQGEAQNGDNLDARTNAEIEFRTQLQHTTTAYHSKTIAHSLWSTSLCDQLNEIYIKSQTPTSIGWGALEAEWLPDDGTFKSIPWTYMPTDHEKRAEVLASLSAVKIMMCWREYHYLERVVG